MCPQAQVDAVTASWQFIWQTGDAVKSDEANKAVRKLKELVVAGGAGDMPKFKVDRTKAFIKKFASKTRNGSSSNSRR